MRKVEAASIHISMGLDGSGTHRCSFRILRPRSLRRQSGRPKFFASVSLLMPPGGMGDPNAVNDYEPILSISHTAPKPR